MGRSMMEADMWLEVDGRWTVRSASGGAEQLFGCDLLGRSAFSLWRSTLGTPHLRRWREAMDTRCPLRYDCLTPAFDMWVEVDIRPASLDGILITFTPVTPERANELIADAMRDVWYREGLLDRAADLIVSACVGILARDGLDEADYTLVDDTATIRRELAAARARLVELSARGVQLFGASFVQSPDELGHQPA